jgi:hypothetical protein
MTSHRLPRKNDFSTDVAVVGGGLAGVAAAVAAARSGTNVYLIERYGFLGGTATGGLVGRFQAGPDVQNHPVIKGIYSEICDRLSDYDALRGNLFDPELMKYVAFDLCEDASVNILLHSLVFDVDTQNSQVKELSVYTKQGTRKVFASTYVDATGDGDISTLAGAQVQVGRGVDHLQQPMTLVFQLGNIDHQRLQTANWDQLTNRFRQEVDILASRGRIFFFQWMEGLLGFVMTHIAKHDGLDIEDLTHAEIESRRQAYAVYKFFRQHVPGCERCVIATTANHIGLRETRRIIGDYVMTREDILLGRKFPDCIGCSTSWIDVHNPDGEGVLHELVISNDWFEIPLRAITVKGLNNLLVAGRCISVTHEAQGSIREIPTCILTGQGAGIAAALAAHQKVPVRTLPYTQLRAALLKQGVWMQNDPSS